MKIHLLIVSLLLLLHSVLGRSTEDDDWLIDIKRIVRVHLKPWEQLLLPEVEPHNVPLYIYTTQNRNRNVLLKDNFDLFNPNLTTKIIIPGWIERANKTWVTHMKDTYLEKGDYNVIVVGWEIYSTAIYITACRQIKPVGNVVVEKLTRLMQLKHLNLEKLHIIGHSLGAHLAGHIGRTLEKRTGIKVARITGLDAAGPFFRITFFPHRTLVATDADYVDAIHTNGALLGNYRSYGTADFYVNGGLFQPGCDNIYIPVGFKQMLKLIYDLIACSHMRSHGYWTESINSDDFKAYQSISMSKVTMGENCPKTAKGRYDLKTNSQPPYARG